MNTNGHAELTLLLQRENPKARQTPLFVSNSVVLQPLFNLLINVDPLITVWR